MTHQIEGIRIFGTGARAGCHRARCECVRGTRHFHHKERAELSAESSEVSDDLFVLMRRSWALCGVKFPEFCVSMYIAEKQYVCDFLNGTSWTSGFAKRRRTQAVKKTKRKDDEDITTACEHRSQLQARAFTAAQIQHHHHLQMNRRDFFRQEPTALCR